MSDDPIARVDAMVAELGPGVSRGDLPAAGDAVLVTGPWLAGVSALAAALRDRLPHYEFVESGELEPGCAPAAVVFVVSAAAHLTGSDCALLDAAAAPTDVIVGVVSKTDVHRGWRETVAANRDALAAHAARYARVPWVGAAARPELGEPDLDDLVRVIGDELADPEVPRRNRLRAWDSRLRTVARRFDRDVEGAGRRARVEALREQRGTILYERRQNKTRRSIALRGQIQQARVQLSHFARNRCSSVRTELQEDAAGLPRRGVPGFEAHARARLDAVVAEVDEGTTAQLAEVGRALGVPAALPPPEQPPAVDVPAPPLTSRRQETVLMTLLGAGFGVGVALTLNRLVSGVASRMAPGLALAAAAACVAIGLVLTLVVVHLRGLLHDRALLDRWVGEVTSSLRSVAEEMVATRVLAAEAALSTALAALDEAEGARASAQVSAIDTELREHAIAAARAAAARDREMPAVRAALDAVRAELGEPAPPEGPGEPASESLL